jgi:hypothetical protein
VCVIGHLDAFGNAIRPERVDIIGLQRDVSRPVGICFVLRIEFNVSMIVHHEDLKSQEVSVEGTGLFVVMSHGADMGYPEDVRPRRSGLDEAGTGVAAEELPGKSRCVRIAWKAKKLIGDPIGSTLLLHLTDSPEWLSGPSDRNQDKPAIALQPPAIGWRVATNW